MQNKSNDISTKKPFRFILSGGGTGGHIYPAIAIANELKCRYVDAEFLFVGAQDKMEMQKVPQAGYEIEGLWIAGIQRKLTFENFKFPFKLLSSLWKSRKIIKKFRPDVVIGTGGFASGPLLKASALAGIPTLIQEQNSFPGITNRWLSKQARIICVAYENLDKFFPKEKIVLTGNPVRQDLINVTENKGEATTYFGLDSSKKTLLILGGSGGARRINQLCEKELDLFKKHNLQVLWQCGKFYFAQYKQFDNQKDVRVFEFIDRMDLAYAVADFIISRSGASSVSELCLVGKPVIFIPSPNVAEDHQTKNAKAIVDKNGALLLKESDLEAQFESTFENLLNDETLQNRLSENIKKLAMRNATKDIVNEIEKLL